MNIENLDKVISFLKELEEPEFNFGDVVSKFDQQNECGTVCCAAGWFPKIFPEQVFWERIGLSSMTVVTKLNKGYDRIAAEILDIRSITALRLFTPDNQSVIHDSLVDLPIDCTPKQLATELEKFKQLYLNGEVEV